LTQGETQKSLPSIAVLPPRQNVLSLFDEPEEGFYIRDSAEPPPSPMSPAHSRLGASTMKNANKSNSKELKRFAASLRSCEKHLTSMLGDLQPEVITSTLKRIENAAMYAALAATFDPSLSSIDEAVVSVKLPVMLAAEAAAALAGAGEKKVEIKKFDEVVLVAQTVAAKTAGCETWAELIEEVHLMFINHFSNELKQLRMEPSPFDSLPSISPGQGSQTLH
jgi:hypothetical protein